jgi:hypothetical protein
MIEGKDRADTIRLTAAALGIGLVDAAFIVGQELGLIESDVVTVDEEGDQDEEGGNDVETVG